MQTGSDAAIDAIRALSARVDQIYLSVDLDVLPHAQMSAVSAPAGRGIPLHVVENLIDAVFRYGPAVPVTDIVEFAPLLDADGLSGRTAGIIARRLLVNHDQTR
nr:arginase family protein [uncultured Paracoccus sp.]